MSGLFATKDLVDIVFEQPNDTPEIFAFNSSETDEPKEDKADDKHQPKKESTRKKPEKRWKNVSV